MMGDNDFLIDIAGGEILNDSFVELEIRLDSIVVTRRLLLGQSHPQNGKKKITILWSWANRQSWMNIISPYVTRAFQERRRK